MFAADAASKRATSVRSDPTGTLPLQGQFQRELNARWDALRRMVPTMMVARTDLQNTIAHHAATGQDAVRAFQKWLDSALKRVVVGDGRWMARYVRDAGDAAIMRAGTLVQQVGDADFDEDKHPRDEHGRWTDGRFTKKLSDVEENLVHQWQADLPTAQEYAKMDRGVYKPTSEYKSFISAIERLPDYHGPAYRGMRGTFSHKVGDVFEIDGIASFTKDATHARNYMDWEMNTNEGYLDKWSGPSYMLSIKQLHSGKDIGELSHAPEMKEVLVRKGTKFKVKKIIKFSDKSSHIELEEVTGSKLRDAAPPTPRDRIPPLQTLAYTELQGIAEAVSQQSVRIFANGLLTRQRPPEIARAVQAIIDKVGRARGNMLVSFIIVRAFSAATLDAYRAAGVPTVGVAAERIDRPASNASPSLDARMRDAKTSTKPPPPEDLVEVLTAGDNDVCPECQDISDEGPYTLDEAENLIPAHPNCRCAFVPADDDRFASVHEDAVEDSWEVRSKIKDAFDPSQPRDKDGKWTSGDSDVLTGDKTITNLNGQKIKAPRTFYRGDNEGDTRRISTGTPEWDKHLFAADNIDAASFYGKSITRIDAKPDAKILYEGTKEFRELAKGLKGNLLETSNAIAQRAVGKYDAVWFKRQGDVGTVILNRDKFINRGTSRTKISDDNTWNEQDHPRDKEGKFTVAGTDPKLETKIEKLKSGATKEGYNFSHFAGKYGPFDVAGAHVLEVDNHHEIDVLNAAAKHGIALTEQPQHSGSTFKVFTAGHAVEAPKAAEPPGHIDMKDLTKVGGKMGSNEGGVYQSPFGDKYYVKTPPSKDHVQNEMLAARLYQLAGVRTMDYVPVKGGDHVATELKALDKNNVSQFSPEERQQAQKDFATHAWLANWDAAGTGGDNQVVLGGKVHTVDVGGSLKYRAQGEPKGAAFGDKVDEINTLRDPSKSPDAAALYGSMTNEQIVSSIKNVTSLSDQKIGDVVEQNMPHATYTQKMEMADKLIARKNDLAKQAIKMSATAPLSHQVAQTGAGFQQFGAPKTPDQDAQPKTFKTQMDLIKHHLLKGTTTEELKQKLGWKAINVPENAAKVGLKLEKIKQGKTFLYKGTPLAEGEKIDYTPSKTLAPKVEAPKAPEPSAFDLGHEHETPLPQTTVAKSQSTATPDELKKAEKNTKLTAQYVPGAPVGHPEAEKLIAAFNQKYEGKTLTSSELQTKVNDFKQLTAAMVPLQSEQQKAQAHAAAQAAAEQIKKTAAIKAEADAKAAKAKADEEEKLKDPVYKAHMEALEGIGHNKHQLNYAQKVIDANKLNITAAEGTAIQAYVGSSYGPVNTALRGGKKMSLAQIKYAQALNDALQKMPVYQGEVYRGVNGSHLMQHYKESVGSVVTELGFTSAGVKSKLWGDLTLNIKSLRARDIRAFNGDEGGGEVVFRKGSHFHVVKVDEKKHQVWLEEV